MERQSSLQIVGPAELLFQFDETVGELEGAVGAGMTILQQRLDEQILGLRRFERLGAVLLPDHGRHVNCRALGLIVRAAVEGPPHVVDGRRALRPSHRAGACDQHTEPGAETEREAADRTTKPLPQLRSPRASVARRV